MAVCGTQDTSSADTEGCNAGGRSFIYAGFVKTDGVVMSVAAFSLIIDNGLLIIG
jgi:hypothetical protein